jgi:hypothetical protein
VVVVVMVLELVPVKRDTARAFVRDHHRHSRPPIGDVIRTGLADDGVLVAVAMAGRPVARCFDDGTTLEVLRVCTLGHDNACSRLYGALARAAKALGYRRLITYTLVTEPGSSLRAVGFVVDNVRARPPAEWRTRHQHLGDLPIERIERVRWVRAL